MTNEEILREFGSRDFLRSIQDENGIDVTQIDRLLSLTPTERIKRLEELMISFEWLTRVARGQHGSNPRTSEPTA